MSSEYEILERCSIAAGKSRDTMVRIKCVVCERTRAYKAKPALQSKSKSRLRKKKPFKKKRKRRKEIANPLLGDQQVSPNRRILVKELFMHHPNKSQRAGCVQKSA